MFKKILTTKLIPLLLIGAVALAACAPATPAADTAATTQAMDAMHMQETQTVMDAMHAQETQTAMEAMDAAHMQETQTAMEAMHMEETAQAQAEFKLSLTGLEDLGPDHAKNFLIGVYLDKELAAEGEGSSKQEAEENAAKNALTEKNWLTPA